MHLIHENMCKPESFGLWLKKNMQGSHMVDNRIGWFRPWARPIVLTTAVCWLFEVPCSRSKGRLDQRFRMSTLLSANLDRAQFSTIVVVGLTAPRCSSCHQGASSFERALKAMDQVNKIKDLKCCKTIQNWSTGHQHLLHGPLRSGSWLVRKLHFYNMTSIPPDSQCTACRPLSLLAQLEAEQSLQVALCTQTQTWKCTI